MIGAIGPNSADGLHSSESMMQSLRSRIASIRQPMHDPGRSKDPELSESELDPLRTLGYLDQCEAEAA